MAEPLLPPFAFEHDGRTFTCRVDALHHRSPEAWWWFSRSGDDRQRYAPFRAEPSDTGADVRARIISYYEDLLARRAAPPQSRWQRRTPGPGAAVPAAPAAPAPETPAG
jgi:hypothetical protein